MGLEAAAQRAGRTEISEPSALGIWVCHPEGGQSPDPKIHTILGIRASRL